jgi:hypothetical protein
MFGCATGTYKQSHVLFIIVFLRTVFLAVFYFVFLLYQL